jgi:hypothetical protein
VLGAAASGRIESAPAAIILVDWAFIIALLHATILGLPAAAIFLRLGWVNVFTAVGAGFVIGALPFGLLTPHFCRRPPMARSGACPSP